jgi:cytochrome c oxidase subunit 2
MQRPWTTLTTLLISLAGAGVAFGQERGYGRPADVSRDGHLSDWLFNVTTVSITVLFIIMVAILVWATLMHRDPKKVHYEHGVGGSHILLTAVISSVIFFGVDGTLLVNSFMDLRAAFWNFPTAAEHPIQIEVMAQQWAWNVRYPGPDGKFDTVDDIVTLNEMHIPVNKPVMIKLRSKDVIHSFYLPNFRTKQDAVPGATTQMWFQATKTGEFEIGCAQHCGVSHYKMRGFLTVTDDKDFEQWLQTGASDSKRRFDEADAEAHWGWDWEKNTNG